MTDLGEHISTIKTNKIKPILLSLFLMAIILPVCVFMLDITLDCLLQLDFLFFLLTFLGMLILTAAFFFIFSINIILMLFRSNTINVYEKGLKIGDIKCEYNYLSVNRVDSKLTPIIVFKTSMYSKIVTGYIKPNDFNLILSKINFGAFVEPLPQTINMSPETNPNYYKWMIKPDIALYFLVSFGVYFLLYQLIFFNYAFYLFVFLFIYIKFNYDTIYLYDDYLTIGAVQEYYKDLYVRVSQILFFRKITIFNKNNEIIAKRFINIYDLEKILDCVEVNN